VSTEIQSPAFRNDTPAIAGHAQWQIASLLWVVAGLLFALLTPATATLTAALQPLLISAMGLSDELLAYRVAFTVFRVPLTALLGILVAVAQCAVVPGIRMWARRWLIASTVGAALSSLVLLPTSLMLIEIAGTPSPEMARVFLALWGTALFGGLVSVFQRRTVRGRFQVPPWFVLAGVLGTLAGAFGRLLLEYSLLSALR
jgi:hypothetical protein